MERWIEVDDQVRRQVGDELATIANTSFDEAPLIELENELASKLGYPPLILASSATAAAHCVGLLMRSLGIVEATVPCHAYPGMVGALESAGLEITCVPVDRDLVRAPSPADARPALHLVHLPWGDVGGGISFTASLRSGVVLLDVSHAVPRVPSSVWTAADGRPIIAVGSLGPGKFLSGMELGFVTSTDPGLLRGIAELGAVRRTAHFGIEPPTATKLRPHPLALAVLRSQLGRLDEKLSRHDATWSYLVPRLSDIDGLRVVTTTGVAERLYWRCVLELSGVQGDRYELINAIATLRSCGAPASTLEYLDVSSLFARSESDKAGRRPRLGHRYISLPGYVDVGQADRDELLRAVRRFFDLR